MGVGECVRGELHRWKVQRCGEGLPQRRFEQGMLVQNGLSEENYSKRLEGTVSGTHVDLK